MRGPYKEEQNEEPATKCTSLRRNVAFSMRGPPTLEQEEQYGTSKLWQRLQDLRSEKQALTREVSAEEHLVNKLQKQLVELRAHRSMLAREKVNLDKEQAQLATSTTGHCQVPEPIFCESCPSRRSWTPSTDKYVLL